jgi:hypothetical protein
MPLKPHQPLGKLLQKFTLRRWRAAQSAAGKIPLGPLRAQRYQARKLRATLTELCHIADDRLALPQIGSTTFVHPATSDWTWRPAAWRVPLTPNGVAAVQDKTVISADSSLFHDCKTSATTARQIRNLRQDDSAPFGLQLDNLHFDGNFLSIVIDLPPEAVAGLRKHHLFQLSAHITAEYPVSITARLNVKHGPNVEQIQRPLQVNTPSSIVVFDLNYTGLVEQRSEKIWLDLVFERPQMNQITLRDLTLCRYQRAQF